MRGSLFALGIVALLGAFVLFFFGYMVVSKHESLGFLGDLGVLFSSDYEKAVAQGYMLILFSGILGIAGLGTAIYGATAQPRTETIPVRTSKPETSPVQRVSYCWKCGTKFLREDDTFCSVCGTPREE